MNQKKYGDAFLEKRIEKYDEWLQEGSISFSSRIIPVDESLETKQWVLPSEQAYKLLKSVDSIALQACECRSHYQRCENPREVCLLFDEVAESFICRKKARKITIDEAAEILKEANSSGLVHLALYMPNHKVYALCSCCSCCCHEMQIIREYGRCELMLHSQYIAETDPSLCMNCAMCIDRCFFSARSINEKGELFYKPEICLGCGLCVSACPCNATRMKIRGAEV